MSATASPDANAVGKGPTFSTARTPVWQPVLLIVITVVTLAICYYTRPVATTPAKGVTMSLPEYIGVWWGTETDVSEAEKRILPPDTEFARKVYEDGIGHRVLCSIVLSGADARSIHRPERCLPGQDWTIGATTTVPVTLNDGRVLRVQVLDLHREVAVAEGKTHMIHDLYCYWFVGDRLTTNSNLERVIRDFTDRAFFNRQHRWAYCIVSAPVPASRVEGGADRAKTWEMLEGFIRDLAPKMLTAETLESLPKADAPAEQAD